MNGVLVTGDLFNLYVFMEISLLAAFALVAYGTRAEEFEAAFKYAVMGSVSSLLQSWFTLPIKPPTIPT